ncbi:CHAT domain-containing protein [Hygrophoropsis aurantiaca]|uniref:CHAT domain-containing protein n=1 Tax=Hygrophoropsis aurantiaca TaxID=72124 RepID=A0ACB8A9D0_9AGAM|nr:CHAT domain-containing protein [Hygrophoropsis aurantiaca]
MLLSELINHTSKDRASELSLLNETKTTDTTPATLLLKVRCSMDDPISPTSPGGHNMHSHDFVQAAANIVASGGSVISPQRANEHLSPSITPSHTETAGSNDQPSLDAKALVELANAHLAQYLHEHSLAGLQHAIEYYTTALDSLGSRETRLMALTNLATSLVAHYERQGGTPTSHLDRAIECYFEVLVELSPNHPYRGKILFQLAVTHMARFRSRDGGGDLDDLDMVIEHYEGVLELSPPGHPDHNTIIISLTAALRTRFEKRGQISDIDREIEYYRSALLDLPLDHTLRFRILIQLANAHDVCFQHNSHYIDDLNLSIEHYTAALDHCSPNQIDHSTALTCLAGMLYTRYESQHQAQDLDLAIERYWSALLEMNPPNHPNRLSLLIKLAGALMTRFGLQNDITDLDQAIEHFADALEMHNASDPDRFKTVVDLASAILTRFRHQGDASDLELSIKHYKSALATCPPDNPTRHALFVNLGSSLTTRFEQQKDMADLDNAIKYYGTAMKQRPLDNSRDTGMTLIGFAGALLARYRHLGDIEELNMAIKQYELAIQLCSTIEDIRRMALVNHAGALISRYQHLGYQATESLDLAVHHYQLVIKTLSPTNPDRSAILTGSAGALSIRYDLIGDLSDLTLSIEQNKIAAEVISPNHPLRPGLLQNLGLSLLNRYNLLGHPSDLDEAVDRIWEGVRLLPLEHLNRPMQLMNLGGALSARYSRKGDDADLRFAIENFEAMLSSCPLGHPDRPKALLNLANTLVVRARNQSEYVDDARRSLDYYREVERIAPPSHPSLRMLHQCYADALMICYQNNAKSTTNTDLLELGIQHYQKSLVLCVQNDPQRVNALLGIAYALLARFVRLHNATDLEASLGYLFDAKESIPPDHPQRPYIYDSLAQTYIHKWTSSHDDQDLQAAFESYRHAFHGLNGYSLANLKVALNWVKNAAAQNHDSLLDAYQTSLELMQRHAMVATSLALRHRAVKRILAASSLAADAASCAIRRGRLNVAVELLEQGRGLLWSQQARLKTPLDNLRVVGGEGGIQLADEFTRLGGLLSAQSTTSITGNDDRISLEEAASRHRTLSSQWDSVVEQIRKVPGFSHFLKPTSFCDLQVAATEGPIVIVNVSQHSCDAIIVFGKKDPLHVPLPDIKLDDVTQLVSEFPQVMQQLSAVGEEKEREKRMIPLLRHLWQSIVSPIAEELGSAKNGIPKGSRIWWCPTSKATSLPLHAAGGYRKGESNLNQLFISSYTPTLSALIRSRKRVSSRKPTFMAIAQANPHEGTNEGELKSVNEEIELVASMVPPSLPFSELQGAKATAEAAITGLRDHSWVHLACHGRQDLLQPFDSSFAMRGRPLKLLDIIEDDLEDREFAFLSACHTAVGDQQTPDEVIHLAAGMQFSGFQSVIGTMWAVDDRAARHMVSAFYKNLFDSGVDSKNAARALNKAAKVVNKEEVRLDQRIVFIHIGA